MNTRGFTRLGAVALLCLGHLTSAIAVTFTHDAFISFADLSNEGHDIVVTHCTLTVDGPHAFNSLQLLNGAVLTHSALPYGPQQFTSSIFSEPQVMSASSAATLVHTNVDPATITVMNLGGNVFYTENVDYTVTFSNQFVLLTLTTNSAIAEGATDLIDYDWAQDFQGFTLTINGDANISADSAINVSGQGYGGGIGVNNGAGANHITNFPFVFTAGGGGGHGGAGGMSSTSARGGASYDSTTNPATLGSGGGTGSGVGAAGGGVAALFVGGNLQVDGQILAAGFRGTNAHSGGGAGGAILLSAETISGAGLISANGGNGDTPDGGGGGGGRIAIYFGTNNFTGTISAFGGGGSTAGGAGTVFLQSNTNHAGQLFIVNGGKRGTNTTFSAAVSDLTISGGAILQAPILPLSVTNLFLGSNSWLMSLDSLPLTVAVNGNATIEPNAIINADFKSLSGAGSGIASCGAGSGGSYGGYGGVSVCGASGGPIYGSLNQPAQLGSPGASGVRAGGAIKLTVAGTLSLAGKISANGASAVAANNGSGSGGSVWLTAGTFSGTGMISANGGSSSNLVSGGGGGGRVAVYFSTNLFTGDITARGGAGTNSGGPGSIYLKTASDLIPQIIFDNGNLVGTTFLPTALQSSDLRISGGATLTNYPATTFTLRSLFIGSNSLFTTMPLNGLSISTTNATIQRGGAMTADGNSTSSTLGAGQTSPFGSGGGGGAGFGGAGQSNAVGGVAIITSFSLPSTAGGIGGGASGLGFGLGAPGGGVISLNVSGTLALDGRISANGATSSTINSGGGAGGSVRVSARTISGTGIISANGAAGNYLGGGGGGGAIALSTDTNLFSGPITATGGNGANYGGAGTIYLTSFALGKGAAQLIVDNGGNRGARTPIANLGDILDLTITGGALGSNTTISSSIGQLRNMTIGSNSALEIFASSPSTLSVSSNLTILAGGTLSADGASSFSSQGMGQTFNSTGGGGGSGGNGGRSTLGAVGGSAFSDTFNSPSSLGGRGGAGANQIGGGNGGGALRITVGGTLRVDGRISADGITATNSNSGGGAGGSVSLTTKVLSGSGVLSANGGAGNAAGGGGGGGHIGIAYNTNLFAGTLTARGGGGANFGGAGIIFINLIPFINLPPTQVIVDNGGAQGGTTPFFTSLQGTANLTITGGAILTNAIVPSLQNLFIGSNSTWLAYGPSTFILTVATNATIQAGGMIIADGASLSGGGVGQTLPGKGGGGGGHGGYGGASISNALGGNITSDSIASPTGPGSLGGGGSISGASGGSGGGTLQITVNGTLQLDGKLSANGTNNPSNINSGGGSGGSVWVKAGKLLGTGSISANGGAATLLGGGGGGGRVAVWYNTNLFTGAITARGGAGANYGGAGTVYLNPSQFGTRPTARLIVDNGGVRGTNTGFLATITSLDLGDVFVTNGATLSVGLSTTPIWNNLTISSNSALTLVSNFNTLRLQINSNLDLQAGGVLNLDGQGFGFNTGSGYGYAATGSGGGAGHGGYGSVGNNINATGGTVYDSISAPTLPGSGGGSGINTSGSTGGGAAQLTVNGKCTINGIITVNGTAANISGAGGGSGGSVFLTVGTISGNGKISADGGNGDVFTSGGGGGGRIAVLSKTNLFAGIASAHGGAGAGLSGGAGTIFWKTNSATFNTVGLLIVDNGGLTGTNTPMISNPPSSLDFSRVALSILNRATVDLPGAALTLQSLSIGSDSGVIAHSLTPLNITVLGNALVDTNAMIVADAMGYNPGSGPGFGDLDIFGEGGGGGYGGAGGASYFGAAGGLTYGSSNQPVDFGSPGGMFPNLNGFSQGGGAIRLTVSGALTVNGNVSANGADGFIDGSGGGAGGSIWIIAQKLSGNGAFTANGGQGESFEGGGGGGGRIAIYTPTNLFAGTIAATGGNGASPRQDGTIYIPTSMVISGNVTNQIGMAIAGILLQPSGLASVTSDTNGYYSVVVPPAWTGSLTPSGSNIIIPGVLNFANLYTNAENQNFLVVAPSMANLSGPQFDGTNLSFGWYGVNGVTYQPFCSSNLVDWVPCGAPIIGGNAPITLSWPTTNAPQMYYRLGVTD